MANGALGEARTRALLLERFTVLTRSVDTHGADFLVELRDAGRFSDELAPRLGIVQAKFAQDEATSHDIAIDYASNGGKSIDEFFVLVTVGHEDAISHYLLTGADVSTLPVTRHNGKQVHVLSATVRRRFRQRKISLILDRIEQGLRRRTEAQNERFLRSVSIPDFELRRSALAPTWFLPIPNEHGYVPDLVYRLRSVLRSQLYAFDNIVEAITRLIKATDAAVCVKALDDLFADSAVEVEAPGAEIVFALSRVDEDSQMLTRAVRIHKRRTAALRKSKLMDRFVQVAIAIRESHQSFIQQYDEPELVPIDTHTQEVSDKHALTEVVLDPTTGMASSVRTSLVPAGTAILSVPHTLVRSRELWRHAHEGGAFTWRELDRLLHELTADHYKMLFPAERIGKPILPAIMAE
jgi:hypothetical protein